MALLWDRAGRYGALVSCLLVMGCVHQQQTPPARAAGENAEYLCSGRPERGKAAADGVRDHAAQSNRCKTVEAAEVKAEEEGEEDPHSANSDRSVNANAFTDGGTRDAAYDSRRTWLRAAAMPIRSSSRKLWPGLERLRSA